MTSVPDEILDIVGQLKELTEEDRLVWKEGPDEVFGAHRVEVSLVSGHWALTQFRGSGTIQVKVRNENGTLLYDFPIEPDDSNYSLAKSIHAAAVQRNRQKERDLALSKMREELATR